ncbi:MAG: 5'-methylthioadenosine/adenosylhomocysteine nucleosidase [Lachnospiraceae bacterium]|nr:5'-methylthioadenosine/adenosylhomocysteine nucleosidase [Lachnospiraceae bacterium]
MYEKIGIIGAMEDEVRELFALMEDKKIEDVGRWKVYAGKLSGKDCVIVRSGIGKVNMAACTQMLVDKYAVDFLINTGVAGSLDAQINIGDIVISTDCLQHDMDAVAFGYALGVIPQMDCSVFVADEKMAELADKVCREVNPEIGIWHGRVLSGDVFVADKARKDHLVSRFDGKCTEMEGAAMAQVAYLNNIPFLVLRAISDKADGSANMDYSQFEKQAIVHNVRLLDKMADKL